MADATVFMELSGIVTVAWQWLKQGIIAQQALDNSIVAVQSKLFYKSKLETMKFFYKYELPKTIALVQTLMHEDKVTIKNEDEILM